MPAPSDTVITGRAGLVSTYPRTVIITASNETVGYPSAAFDYGDLPASSFPADVHDPVAHNKKGSDSDPTFVKHIVACLAPLERLNPGRVDYFVGPQDGLVHLNPGVLQCRFYVRRCMAENFDVQLDPRE